MHSTLPKHVRVCNCQNLIRKGTKRETAKHPTMSAYGIYHRTCGYESTKLGKKRHGYETTRVRNDLHPLRGSRNKDSWKGIVLKKGKQKSPGRATSRSRSQPPTPGGREKVTQINVCIANKQMHDKHKTSSLFPKQGDQNAKRTEETHRQRAGQDQTWSAT